ncbi:chaperonin 10-like protein, partial [Endogone sp. FLAS-F59071]
MPRAVQLHSVGTSLVLTSDHPRPVPQAGEVLVRTHAIALNPIDYKQIRFGLYLSTFPVVLGKDFSGVVEEVGEGVKRWKAGDRVFGFPSAK